MSNLGRRISEASKLLIFDYIENKVPVRKVKDILLNEHGEEVSIGGIYKLVKRGKIYRKPRSTTQTSRKIKDIHLKFMNYWLSTNGELTARKIRDRLFNNFNVDVSVSRIKQLRRELGWKSATKGYCQLISNKNKKVRLEWCCKSLAEKDEFLDVIFTDESSVEMSSHGKFYFQNSAPRLHQGTSKRPKPKHAYKVHVWAGISYRGRTSICIFTGNMNSIIYQKILEANLLPFVQDSFPDGFRLYQDNDSKHVSKSTKEWMRQKNILDCVMQTPASSPDLNPIENVWSAMKHHLETEIKPKTKDELVTGIVQFWKSLTPEKCRKYIDHIHRVIPAVILASGDATRF
ncbi:hypothetical protein FSP39_015728 [Pinctada imbricata]|uniref:Tc1-like transposase DDE domain-containing protein n=1 Tax=Pinctada imbricata TaxID=66713 RepID=A0AA89CDV7_PINIB|nr:hypothetical protein FSP39_008787 [Pinctada imbricata]KAK3108787.1 hypothetical protein FSP39_015728 [Pinctada imbricata]